MDQQQQRVLVISFSDVRSDPRVYRQVDSLSSLYKVSLLHLGDDGLDGIDCINIGPGKKTSFRYKCVAATNLLLRRYDAFYWRQPHLQRILAAQLPNEVDLIVANDLNSLLLAVRLKSDNTRLVFDAHEYSTRELESTWWWKLLFQPNLVRLLRKLGPMVDASMTVCQGLADQYRREFGLETEVVYNAPPFHELTTKPTSPEKIRLVHHGIPVRERRIELMIEMMRYLDQRFSLDFYLMDTDSRYLQELKALAADNPAIQFQQPMAMREIPAVLNENYDMGVFLLPPENFNYHYALPNKFFEFIQARLAVAIGPSPEMARIVRKENLGIVADSFEARDLAQRIGTLRIEDIDAFKARSNKASEFYSYRSSEEKMLDVISSVF